MARLVRIEPAPGVGARFPAARGSLAGLISIAEAFDLTSSSPTTCASTFSAAAFASPSPPITALGVGQLPMHHRDPFDRLLISQARAEALTIVTADRRFTAYDVSVIAAAA